MAVEIEVVTEIEVLSKCTTLFVTTVVKIVKCLSSQRVINRFYVAIVSVKVEEMIAAVTEEIREILVEAALAIRLCISPLATIVATDAKCHFGQLRANRFYATTVLVRIKAAEVAVEQI